MSRQLNLDSLGIGSAASDRHGTIWNRVASGWATNPRTSSDLIQDVGPITVIFIGRNQLGREYR